MGDSIHMERMKPLILGVALLICLLAGAGVVRAQPLMARVAEVNGRVEFSTDGENFKALHKGDRLGSYTVFHSFNGDALISPIPGAAIKILANTTAGIEMMTYGRGASGLPLRQAHFVLREGTAVGYLDAVTVDMTDLIVRTPQSTVRVLTGAFFVTHTRGTGSIGTGSGSVAARVDPSWRAGLGPDWVQVLYPRGFAWPTIPIGYRLTLQENLAVDLSGDEDNLNCSVPRSPMSDEKALMDLVMRQAMELGLAVDRRRVAEDDIVPTSSQWMRLTLRSDFFPSTDVAEGADADSVQETTVVPTPAPENLPVNPPVTQLYPSQNAILAGLLGALPAGSIAPGVAGWADLALQADIARASPSTASDAAWKAMVIANRPAWFDAWWFGRHPAYPAVSPAPILDPD
jgi:hypothetical protein